MANIAQTTSTIAAAIHNNNYISLKNHQKNFNLGSNNLYSNMKAKALDLYSWASHYVIPNSSISQIDNLHPFSPSVLPPMIFIRVVALSLSLLSWSFSLVCSYTLILVQFIQLTLNKYPTANKYVSIMGNLASDFVTNHRGILVTLIVNPCSRIWESVDKLNDWVSDSTLPKVGNVARRLAIHQDRIQKVQVQIQQVVGLGATRLCTDRPGYLTMSMRQATYKSKWTGINVHALRDVIQINQDRQVVLVEPGCTMGRLSRLLLSQGWTLQVIPELDELTVGGLINGFGIETSSHKYGLFQHTCVAFEIVLPSGDFVKCDMNTHPDLFASIPWSHGTIGFLVGAEIKLVRAAPYVRIEYMPCFTAMQSTSTFEKMSRNMQLDFVEALQFSRETSVVMVGQFAKSVPKGQTLNVISKWYKPWFYTHVQSILTKSNNQHHAGSPVVEYVPIRDYYHRHTKSLFWAMKDIVPYGNSIWYRYLFNWIGTPKVGLLKLCTTPKMDQLWTTKQVAQDLLVPMISLDYMLDMIDSELGVYPIWLCPMRMLSPAEDLLALRKDGNSVLKSIVKDRAGDNMQQYKQLMQQDLQPVVTPKGSFTPPNPCDQLYVDVGVYGLPTTATFHHIRTLERVEDHVRSVQGFSACYADIVSTKEEFRKMFDHRTLDTVRQVYRAHKLLPDVYEKVHVSARS